MQQVLEIIHTGLRRARFEKPNTVSSATICADTGKKARTGCTNTYTEYFLWLTTPGLCDEHSGDEVGNISNTNSTQNNNTQEIVQGITQDIDATEPPRTDLNTTNTTNETTTNNSGNTITNTSRRK